MTLSTDGFYHVYLPNRRNRTMPRPKFVNTYRVVVCLLDDLADKLNEIEKDEDDYIHSIIFADGRYTIIIQHSSYEAASNES